MSVLCRPLLLLLLVYPCTTDLLSLRIRTMRGTPSRLRTRYAEYILCRLMWEINFQIKSMNR